MSDALPSFSKVEESKKTTRWRDIEGQFSSMAAGMRNNKLKQHAQSYNLSSSYVQLDTVLTVGLNG